ncbi:MAG: YeeE/YedE thiosulfate transporter family protein [Gallionellaceae bacterium]|nr:YeeE/YedE thiosulfate transporter family protein [Gallionellaceae bacterium]
MTRYLPYLLVGVLFGFVLIKAETASWYRIQEMFHFQSFHMFGILISAIITGLISVQIVKRMNKQTALDGQAIDIPEKAPGRKSYIFGGLIFGFGWGLIGLCPGPIFALVGTGSLGAVVVLAGALHGTWLYGALKQHMPH